jgi:two-component system LytT family sensor kinase
VVIERRPLRWRFALVIFGGWTAVGLATSAMLFIQGLDHTLADPLSAKRMARILVDVWCWALYTPFIFELARELPVTAATWKRNLPLHFLPALATAVLDALVALWIQPFLGPYRAPTFAAFFTRTASLSVYSYFAMLALGHALEYHRLFTERQLRAAELERQLAETRLGVLEAQLRPHFLFNALHTVGSLVRAGEQSAAVSAIARLGELLRQALRGGPQQEVTLREELAFATHYLELEKARFRDRLATRIDVDAALLEAFVPRFLLQPLVENAVRHGIEPSEQPGRVEVTASRAGDSLVLEVRDTGAGPDATSARQGGIGLGNTRERLRHLYGSAASLELGAVQGGGTVVTVTLPFRTGRRAEAA